MASSFGDSSGGSVTMPWTMYDRDGQRKYLTRAEMGCFVRAAKESSPAVQGFCLIIAATGCRISEALALSARNLDFEAGTVVIECLKKRGRRVFRAIPVQSSLLGRLKKWLASGLLEADRLFPWSRMTGYRRICEIMQMAGIRGAYATPKGLRHAFGINAIQSGVPLNMVQRWLGHADIKTTAIYTSASGEEERAIAQRMWIGEKSRASRRAGDGIDYPTEIERESSPSDPRIGLRADGSALGLTPNFNVLKTPDISTKMQVSLAPCDTFGYSVTRTFPTIQWFGS